MIENVLIFENDDEFAGKMKTGFEDVGIDVRVVNDGPTGLDHAKTQKPDLVIVDAELHGMNGFLVCKKFKKDNQLKDIPLIILSNEDGEEIFEQHRRLPTSAQDYMCKPVEFEELFGRAQNLFLPKKRKTEKEGESDNTELEIIIEEEEITIGDDEKVDKAVVELDGSQQSDVDPFIAKKRMFVASSAESSKVMESICQRFEDDVEVEVFSPEDYGSSEKRLSSIVEAASNFDFAILFVSPEDFAKPCKDGANSPRDNFLLELGILIGVLGNERVYVVYQEEGDVRIPNDMAGVVPISYSLSEEANPEDFLQSVWSKINEQMGNLSSQNDT